MSVDVGAAVVDGGCVVNHDGNNHYRLVYADAQRTRAVLHAQLRSVGACDTSTPQGMECVQLYAAQAAGLVDDAVYAGMVGAVPLEDVVDVLHTVWWWGGWVEWCGCVRWVCAYKYTHTCTCTCMHVRRFTLP